MPEKALWRMALSQGFHPAAPAPGAGSAARHRPSCGGPMASHTLLTEGGFCGQSADSRCGGGTLEQPMQAWLHLQRGLQSAAVGPSVIRLGSDQRLFMKI